MKILELCPCPHTFDNISGQFWYVAEFTTLPRWNYQLTLSYTVGWEDAKGKAAPGSANRNACAKDDRAALVPQHQASGLKHSAAQRC